jgi:hypothetical protein
LLKIDSALTLVCFARRDDADVFFFLIWRLHAIHMDNQRHSAQSSPYGIPPLFALNNAALAENSEWIVENKGGRFECEATVLPPVDPVLFIVPLKMHRYTKCITLRFVDGPRSRQPRLDPTRSSATLDPVHDAPQAPAA